MSGFPIDWNEWQTEWRRWRAEHADDLKPTRERFPGKNFLADEILGTWKVNGRVVELSEVVFPNLTDRDERGFLRRYYVRGVGLTYAVGVDAADDRGSVVHSFAELEQALGIAR